MNFSDTVVHRRKWLLHKAKHFAALQEQEKK